LSLHYFFSQQERDLAKAAKCLDKVIQLRPDHSEAGVLYYHLLVEQGNVNQAFDILSKVSSANPLLTYPHYLQGVRA
jgi:thioredoxin-like negative regulator of GroEL